MKKRLYSLLTIVLLVVFGIGFLSSSFRPNPVLAASGGRIYMDPAGGSFTKGATFTTRVYVSSPSPVNAAFVNIYYNGRGLQFVSAQRGAGFPNQNAPTQHTAGDTGVIKMESTRSTTQAGNFHFATITFRATAAGTWGVRPGTESSIINYPSNTVSFTIGRADFTVTEPVVQPPVTPNPPTTPTPTPTPTPSTPPSGGTDSEYVPESEPTDPISSEASESGMQITDLTVTEIDYRTALVSWGTTNPSPSKINYSTSEDDLFNEKTSEEVTTSHSIRLEGDDLRAGKQYFFRVSAADGEEEPVTLDDTFTTKPISVVIKVTDTKDSPVAEALVQAADAEGITDENGEVTMDLPEGDVTIFAQKEELSKELNETIEIPTDENAPRFTLALSRTAEAAKVTVPAKKKTPWLVVLLPVLFLAAGAGGFLFWRKRNMQKTAYYGDPLEAENYTNEVMPSTPVDMLPQETPPVQQVELQTPPESPAAITPLAPEPSYLPVEDPHIPHHATLPELLGRYGTEAAEEASAQTPLPAPTEPMSPTGQQIPQHVSLKDLVETPAATKQPSEPEPEVFDLPASPVSNQTSEPTTQEPDQSNGSLTIKH